MWHSLHKASNVSIGKHGPLPQPRPQSMEGLRPPPRDWTWNLDIHGHLIKHYQFSNSTQSELLRQLAQHHQFFHNDVGYEQRCRASLMLASPLCSR